MGPSYRHLARKAIGAWLDARGKLSVDEPDDADLELLAACIDDEMRGVAIATRRELWGAKR